MLVTHITIPKNISVSFIKSLEEKFENCEFYIIKKFYDEYCKENYKYDKKKYDITKVEESELYLVDNEENIYIRRYIKSIYDYGLNTLIFPHTFMKKEIDYGDGVFCINIKDSILIGCAENMRYVNRKVFHEKHLVVLALQCIGGL